MALTFESGLDGLMQLIGLKGEEAFYANEIGRAHV